MSDRNKSIKEINKKRKKAGLSDLSELNPPENRIFKIDGQSVLINKNVTTIDISRNNLLLNDTKTFVKPLIEEIKAKGSIAIASAGSFLPITLVCKGAAFGNKQIEDICEGQAGISLTTSIKFFF